MEILGVGPTELLFIIFIALIILGPKDMQKAGRSIGRWLNNLVTSDGWHAFRDTSREIRNLPNHLMQEANLEDLDREIGQIGKETKETVAKNLRQERFGTWGRSGAPVPAPASRPAPAVAPKPVIASPKPPAQPGDEPNKGTEPHA